MKADQIVDFCFQKETSALKHLDHEAIRKSELRPQELHLELKRGKLSILRRHPNQDESRNNFLISLLKYLGTKGTDSSELNFEFIFNSSDGIDFFEEGVPRLGFTRRVNHPNLLLPNPYIGQVDSITKSIPNIDSDFSSKKDSAIFVGSYSGGHLPKDNQRFLFCINNKDSELGTFKISNFCVETELLSEFEWQKIKSDYIPYTEQLEHKYIFNINGNTNCWDRLLWAMNSNSLCLFLRPKREDMCWHYHYLKAFGGFVYVDETDWEGAVSFFNKNPNIADKLSKFQQQQTSEIVKTTSSLDYFAKVIKFYNDLYNKNT
jgi:hypothetical protein